MASYLLLRDAVCQALGYVGARWVSSWVCIFWPGRWKKRQVQEGTYSSRNPTAQTFHSIPFALFMLDAELEGGVGEQGWEGVWDGYGHVCVWLSRRESGLSVSGRGVGCQGSCPCPVFAEQTHSLYLDFKSIWGQGVLLMKIIEWRSMMYQALF